LAFSPASDGIFHEASPLAAHSPGVLMEQSLIRAPAQPVFTPEDVRLLYVEHSAALRLTLSRLAGSTLDPDDLLQEVFVIAIRKSADLGRATSRRAWLCGVAVKVATTRRRTARLLQFFHLDETQHFASPESPQRTVEQRDASARVQQVLQALSDAKRTVFVLFELQGFTGEEIAQALSIPLKTVWTRLFHARRAFEKELQRLQLLEARRTGLTPGALDE
jgi:RNA polymerase sigma-70 factor, ECF subfamily